MAKDVGDVVKGAVGQVVRDATQSVGGNGRKSGSSLSGARGLAAGAGLAALAPLAKKGVGALIRNRSGNGASGPGDLISKAGDKVGDKVKDTVSDKVDEAGGVGGIAKEGLKSMVPGGGGGSSGGGEAAGTGKGRRMPVQQAVDVAVPLETAYNQWTQFEEWPNFMHRLDRVSQDDDDCTVSFKTKIWGFSREFTAEIETQRPDERIKWKVTQGVSHVGVVSFHELAPRLTRIELTLDVQPGSLIEKAARGMRHVKRAIRGDLHRYKAFIEVQEVETGAWRGVIEEGELVEEHPEDYDEQRDYADSPAEVSDEGDDRDEDDDSRDEDRDEDDDSQEEEKPRRSRQRSSSRSGSSSRRRTRGSTDGGNGGRRSRSTSNRKSSGSRSSGNSSSGKRTSKSRS
jgi:uncharacterized membrane protein